LSPPPFIFDPPERQQNSVKAMLYPT